MVRGIEPALGWRPPSKVRRRATGKVAGFDLSSDSVFSAFSHSGWCRFKVLGCCVAAGSYLLHGAGSLHWIERETEATWVGVRSSDAAK